MISAALKGISMRKRLVVLVVSTLLPVWALSQGQSGAKAQQPQLSAQAKARAAADHTARLQARAIEQARAQAAVLAKAAKPASSHQPVAAAPTMVVPAFVSPPPLNTQLNTPLITSQAPLPMQPLPTWAESQPTQRRAFEPLPVAAVPTLPAASALAAVPLLMPVDSGLAVAAPVAQSAADPLSQDLAIAQQIHQGLMPCELGASVRVQADAAAPGYFHVQGKGFRYRMYPVHTSTGALRLEDKKAGAVWLQLANKSMLMDQKKGRRVADDCAHPEQVAYGQDMKTNPPPSLFDKTGMGRSND